MYLLIPLGGIGQRFKDCGYSKPKPLINVLGKHIIFWLLENLDINTNDRCVDKIIIPYNKELKKYNFENIVKKRFYNYNFEFICLDTNTNGCVETILYGLNNTDTDDTKPILILDGDNFYTTNIIKMWNRTNTVFVFDDGNNEPIYSYIETSEDKYINKIVEKEKISNLASTGAYGFSSVNILKTYAEYIINNNIRSKNEYYTSTVINEMLKQNIKFQYEKIDTKNYICLGTPMQLRLFCNNYPKISSLTNETVINPLRFCFDLDNTLVTYPVIQNDYRTVKPIIQNINYLKYLKKFGHTIIIYTARRMKTFNSNLGQINKDIGKITFDTLDKFDIPYDELYFGKPYADFYIDDLAINAYDSFEKEIGFYENTIDPRDFNNISKTSIDIIKKQSETTLNGEIYYYLNIPLNIKDMFPVMFDYDKCNMKSYDIEYIDGVSVSKLYLSEQLTLIQFENILNSIERIHKSVDKTNITQNVNIYSNYHDKLVSRYSNYNYDKYENSENIYKKIIKGLKEYEHNKKGIISVIHGDTVFTNIIINKYEKIKFIDMRGKMGEELTIYGDELYDWAKLYQSLIGYDEILGCTNIKNEYKKQFIDLFLNKIKKLYNEEYIEYIKIITQSLLFSLLPLHDNANCYEFFKLIQQV